MRRKTRRLAATVKRGEHTDARTEVVREASLVRFEDHRPTCAGPRQAVREADRLQGSRRPPGMDSRQPRGKGSRPSARGGIPSGGACSRVVVQLLDGGPDAGDSSSKDISMAPSARRTSWIVFTFSAPSSGRRNQVIVIDSSGRFDVDAPPRDGSRFMMSGAIAGCGLYPPHPFSSDAIPEVDHRAVEDVDRAVVVREEREIEFQADDHGPAVDDVTPLPQVRVERVPRAPDVIAVGSR